MPRPATLDPQTRATTPAAIERRDTPAPGGLLRIPGLSSMIVGFAVAVVGRRSLAAIARLGVGCSCDGGKNRHDAAPLPRTAGVDPEEAPRSDIDVDEAAPWVETNAHESDGSSETRNLVVSRSGDHEIERTAPAVVGPTV